ncbi:ABC transporter substrate-binding protein [Hyphomicrobium sp. 99]|uniref:ABC transporter substrate-binding protein n=1 Tax=Hyphomicrobium sp. 99 TaxID=1163419 RepID=UPI0005F8922C|nr:ABC transporter substrate-binding protein [Hyphomicrobium sp. 99]
MKKKSFTNTLLALSLVAVSAPVTAHRVSAAENVSVAIISFSPYAPWYIVKAKGLAKNINLDVKIIEGITEKNAAITSGQVQCMNNTMDSMVLARAGDLPVKVVAFSDMSYGLDKMVVTKDINSVEDFKGKKFGADYGFLNHMWMLLTLKRAGIDVKELQHAVMLPQESAAAFASGGIDIDVNYDPFASQSLKRDGAKIFKSSLTDRTWERGLISDAIACNQAWLAEKPAVAKELLRAWFEAVNWWKENPEEGDAIVAAGLSWPVADVKLNQYGAIMLNINQNLGALGLEGGKPLCESLPAEAPRAPADVKGWGSLFNGPDCVAGYAESTWDLFSETYFVAGVSQKKVKSNEAFDTSLLSALAADGLAAKYSSNKWIGRLGPQ